MSLGAEGCVDALCARPVRRQSERKERTRRRYRAAARAYLKISQRLRRKIERRSPIGAKTESIAQGGPMVGKHGDKTDRPIGSLHYV